MATVRTIIERAYTKVNGEYETQVEGSDDWKTYLNVLNQVMGIWFRTPYVKWQSLFDANFELDTPVEAGRLIYPVGDTDRIKIANSPYDHVFIMDDDVVAKRYKLVDQAQFQDAEAGDICMYAGGNLYFKGIPDDMVGYAIRLPAYVLPAAYTTGSQEVNIDSVTWLVTKMAAFICDASPVPFIARNATKFEEEAKIYMKEMIENNRRSQRLALKSTGANNRNYPSLSAAVDAGVGVGGINGLDGGTF